MVTRRYMSVGALAKAQATAGVSITAKLETQKESVVVEHLAA